MSHDGLDEFLIKLYAQSVYVKSKIEKKNIVM